MTNVDNKKFGAGDGASPPPLKKKWEDDMNSEVMFLDSNTFASTLKQKKHVLVMFYAPWCSYCKSAKPEYEAAALEFKDDPRTILAAVDCTQHPNVCQQQGVTGYPTITYYSYFRRILEYNGAHLRKDFVEFMSNCVNGRA